MLHFHGASGFCTTKSAAIQCFFFNADSEKDDALSGIAAHLQGRRRTFTDYGALARKTPHLEKDGASARKTVHFWDCGELGTCAAHAVGRKAAHVTPCFQVRVWHICCILFDAYRICILDRMYIVTLTTVL